jgi:hypothetical protein
MGYSTASKLLYHSYR